jgi:hypothetical protein
MSDNLGAAVEKSKTEASGNLKKSFSWLDEKENFVKEQLWKEMFEKLANLDVANYPKVEKHLILFLIAAWFTKEELIETKLFQNAKNKVARYESIREANQKIIWLL